MTSSIANRRRVWLRLGLWLAIPIAFAWALRGVDMGDLAASLRQLTWSEVVALAAVNVAVVLLFSGRWWVILRSRGHRLPYLATSAYRLAGFAISYFTPGTHFGGEPLQVHLIRLRHAVPVSAATASVVLDKTIELTVNFAFLAIGLTTVVVLELQPLGSAALLLAASLTLCAVPLVYLAAAWRGAHPAAWLVRRVGLRPESEGWQGRTHAWLEASEREVGAAARQAPMGLGIAVVFSIVSWGILLIEWWMAMRFLGMEVGAAEVVAIVTAARLALFVPLPGAAGALEASLVFALTRLGFSAAQALSLAIVIRIRDIAFGAFGLWLGGWLSGGAARSAGDSTQDVDLVGEEG